MWYNTFMQSKNYTGLTEAFGSIRYLISNGHRK